ncbi:hypothetical protein LCGC14_0220260 [marine sediment metagenome]|uniref:Uncharacterized protein n=1 Tax=marine sediment metagenome TaxID=412755 RepID=A0A0F9UD97_9ZZZZ
MVQPAIMLATVLLALIAIVAMFVTVGSILYLLWKGRKG